MTFRNTPYNERMMNTMNHTIPPKKINKVLIAEDNDESSFYLKLILSPLCNEIIIVKTGMDAVDTCKNNPDIQIVLMDIQMPDLDGFEATRQIRLFNSDVVIIAQTAFAFSDDRKKALAAGCNDYLSKPFRKVDMLEVIEKYF